MKKSLLMLVLNYGLGNRYYSHGLLKSFLLQAGSWLYIYIKETILLALKIKTFF